MTIRVRFPSFFLAIAIVVLNCCFARADKPAQVGEEVRVAYPGSLAFSDGSIDHDALQEAVKSNVAEIVKEDGNETVIRSIRFEVFEKSKESTKERITLFALVESRYYLTTEATKPLQSIKIGYIFLGYDGQLKENRSWQATYTSSLDDQHKEIWIRKIQAGPDGPGFYKALPQWAKAQLCLASGFLDKNPTALVVDFDRVAEHIAKSCCIFAIEVVPLSIPGGKVAESLVAIGKGASGELLCDKLVKALQADELQWGCATAVSNEIAIKGKAMFQKDGEKMWK